MKNFFGKYRIIITGLIIGILFFIVEILLHVTHITSHDFHGVITGFISLGFIIVLSVILQFYNVRQGRYEYKLKEQNEELKETNKLKSEFLRRASHELKTPLIAVKGFSGLLLEFHQEKLDKNIISMLVEIKNGCARFESVISKIIESSKLESSMVKLQTSMEDLSFLIKFCLKELDSQIKARNHTITVDIRDKIMVLFDKEQMFEVISNLLINAIKYTPSNGTISIQIELKDHQVVVKVQDTGIGFTEKEKKQIFQQFGKIEHYGQGLDLEISGSGLGLYFSKKIVELHGGKIWVESEGRSKGSTFYFTLPRN
jgi:signal transduction histidine kinase